MAVTKADIVQSIMDQIGFTKIQSSEVSRNPLESVGSASDNVGCK
jgi:hypothetical protein